MKHLVRTIAMVVLLSPMALSAQFEKFEKSDKIGSVTINKGMMGIVASMSADDKNKEAREFIELAKSINEIKVFISEDAKASADMTTTAKRYIKKSSLESLMKVKEGNSRIDFYIKNGKNDNYVSELLMLVSGMDKKGKGTGFETVLVTMQGTIDLTKVGSLVNKMNLPKDLKKASKKSK
jgi:hypothetical protein